MVGHSSTIHADSSPAVDQVESNLKMNASERQNVVNNMLAKPLTIKDAELVAFLNANNIYARYYDLQLHITDAQQGLAITNPSVGFGIIADRSNSRTELTIEQDLMGWILHGTKASWVDALTKAQIMEFSQAFLEFSTTLKKAYYSYLAAQEAHLIQANYADAAKATFDLQKRQYKAGTINELQLKLGEVTVQNTIFELQKSELTLAQLRLDLQLAMGLDPNQTEWKIEGKLREAVPKIPTLTELDTLIDTKRLDIAAIRFRITAEENRLDAQELQDKIGSLKAGFIVAQDIDGKKTISPKVEVGIPLFNQGQLSQSKKNQATRQLSETMEDAKLKAQYSVRKLVTQLEYEHQQIIQIKTHLIPLHDKVADLTQAHYNNLLAGTYALIESRQEELNARQA